MSIRIVAAVAPGAASGSVRVLHNGVLSNALPFDVNSLHITGVDLTSESPGTQVTITGTGFGTSQGSGTVQLGSTSPGQILSWSDTQVVATVASSALTGIAQIQQNGVRSNAKGFTVPVPGGNTLDLSTLTMVVGDTRTLHALSASGQPATGLSWTSSDPAKVSLSSVDPPLLTALAAGHVTITAGTATTEVTVFDPVTLPGGTLPLGTVLWSNPGNGSGVTKIVPAVPSPRGVADVFAFQNDGTVQAITAEGVTAWTANISLEADAVPDFEGGLIVSKYDEGTQRTSILKLDGITGQPSSAYTAQLESTIAVHTDGTVFAVQYSETGQHRRVIGIESGTGTLKFSIPLPCDPGGTGLLSGPIIAGDGKAYVPFDCADGTNDHFALLRVSSSGAFDYVTIADYSGWADDGYPVQFGGMITNADQGVLLTWKLLKEGSPDFTSWMAITTGSSASVMEMHLPPDLSEFKPVLQAQDGSFVGEYTTYSADDYQYTMVAFDTSGSIRWSVANERPQIATADGGVIGKSGITYDQNGGATGQIYNGTPSWTAQTYSLLGGSLGDVVQAPPRYASSFGVVAGGNLSENATSIAFLTWMEALPLFARVGVTCQLGNTKANLGGAALDQYTAARQALLSGNYLTSQSCSTFFNASGRDIYFSQLTNAVSRQIPFDGLRTTISMYDAGIWNLTDVNKPTFPAQWKKTPICMNFPNLSSSNLTLTVAEAQVQAPAHDVYINTNAKVFKKELTQSTILHEALHNLTLLNDSALAEVLGTTLAGSATNTINKVLVSNGCAGN